MVQSAVHLRSAVPHWSKMTQVDTANNLIQVEDGFVSNQLKDDQLPTVIASSY